MSKFRIKSIYSLWQTGNGYEDVPELCKSATIDEIRKANYSLTFKICELSITI